MFKNKRRNFIVSTGLDNFGDGLMTIFFPLVMLSLTSDPLIFSLSYVVKTFSSVLSSFISGYILDFYSILKATKIAKIIRLVALILVILLPVNITLILFGALIFGATEVFVDNATQTISLSIYQKSELIHINNKIQSMEYFFGFFLGPIIGTFLFKPYNTILLYFALIIYVLALFYFFLLHDISHKEKNIKKNVFKDMTHGVIFLFNHISLRILCFYAASFCLVIASLFSIFPLIVSSKVNEPQFLIGLFYALNSLGFVWASSITTRISRFFSTKKILFISLVFAFFSSVILVFNNSVYSMIISVFFLGCGMGGWGCIAVTYRQKVIPEGVFSRTNAVYRLFSWGALCLGGVIGGSIYQINGYYYLFYIMLIFTFFLTVSFYFITTRDNLS